MRFGPVKVLLLATMLGLSACADPGNPPGVYAGQGQDRRVVTNIEFDFDSFRIRPGNFAQLDNVAAALNDPALAGSRFEIDGHTDISGRLAYNISLSQLRAAAVLDYLAQRGVPPQRMRAQGFGPLQLLDPSFPRSPANRRVEVVATPF